MESRRRCRRRSALPHLALTGCARLRATARRSQPTTSTSRSNRAFRRTYSSWAHDKRVPAKVVAQIMGHTKVDTTMNVYTQCSTARLA
ncbi:MAG: hypothetical protein DMF95_22540 [Acidobacteria bacterium]|nr:MAG: hypothetical protein DMF95_22540 [Acidobacteriota bacterium]